MSILSAALEALANPYAGRTMCHAPMSMLLTACKRPLHSAPPGVDEQPVCLMHSKDPAKNSDPLNAAFWQEFETILEAAGEGTADFRGFIFPYTTFNNREIKANCIFDRAVFTARAKFQRLVNFTRGASFNEATFTEDAVFDWVTFGGDSSFESAIFLGPVTFSKTVFKQRGEFTYAGFAKEASFQINFEGKAAFDFTEFKAEANFLYSRFIKDVSFARARFSEKATFYSGFEGDSWFIATIFEKAAEFKLSNFALVDYRTARFLGPATWERCTFAQGLTFSKTEFSSPDLTLPQASFALASFDKPDKVLFNDVDLSRTLFNNCDISDMRFTSSVRWGSAPRRKAVLYDEIVPLDTEWTESLLRNGERDYKAIAQAYQRLKKNYDGQLDYWTANEFHFGEMEMQRRDRPTTGPMLTLRRWWHPRLSFKAWYRYASDYGNNYSKPMQWLIAVLIVFALGVPIAGLQRTGATASESYSSIWHASGSKPQRLRWEAGLFGKSLLVAVDTATFQKGAEYTPAYPWGRVLAIIETLLTSTLFALFLLAIRRQFRR